ESKYLRRGVLGKYRSARPPRSHTVVARTPNAVCSGIDIVANVPLGLAVLPEVFFRFEEVAFLQGCVAGQQMMGGHGGIEGFTQDSDGFRRWLSAEGRTELSRVVFEGVAFRNVARLRFYILVDIIREIVYHILWRFLCGTESTDFFIVLLVDDNTHADRFTHLHSSDLSVE